MINYGDRGTADPTNFYKALPAAPERPESALDKIDTSKLKNNEFLGYTREGTPGYKPRPTSNDGPYRHAPADALEAARDRWDAAEEWAKANDKLRADRIAREEAQRTADREQREATEAANRTEARAELEARLKRTFMQNPAATAADWERAKDGVIARHLEEEAMRTDQARHAMNHSVYGNF